MARRRLMMALFAVSVHWSLWTLFVGPSRAHPTDPSGGGAAELEAAAAAQFGALPPSMAAGGAARRAAVRRYQSKLGKKACSAKRRGRKRLDCGLRLQPEIGRPCTGIVEIPRRALIRATRQISR